GNAVRCVKNGHASRCRPRTRDGDGQDRNVTLATLEGEQQCLFHSVRLAGRRVEEDGRDLSAVDTPVFQGVHALVLGWVLVGRGADLITFAPGWGQTGDDAGCGCISDDGGVQTVEGQGWNCSVWHWIILLRWGLTGLCPRGG